MPLSRASHCFSLRRRRLAAVLALEMAAVLAVVLVSGAGASTYRVVAYGPTWSPDGKQIAFVMHVAGTGATQHLELVNAADGSGKRIVYSSNDACCGGPVQWSSAQRIVLDDDYRVKTVDLATSRVKTIADFSDFDVSKDGRSVAGWAGGGPESKEIIGVVSITGKGYRLLPKPKNASDSQPDYSPNGKRLVFARAHVTVGGAWPSSIVIEPATGGPARSLGVSGDLPRWSPDGRWIAFVGGSPGAQAVLIVKPSGGRPRVLIHGRFFNVLPGLFSWSPDSKRLAVVIGGGTTAALATIDLSGHRRQLDLGMGVAPLSTPQWSPDGKQIAFTGRASAHSGTRVDVYIIGADGRGLRRLS